MFSRRVAPFVGGCSRARGFEVSLKSRFAYANMSEKFKLMENVTYKYINGAVRHDWLGLAVLSYGRFLGCRLR